MKEEIVEGVWQSGERLPSEAELADQFNVSNQTIRGALHSLEQTGLLEIRPGASGGPIVKDTILSSISSLYLYVLKLEKGSVEDFISARIAIASAILNEAIDNMDDQDIKDLLENVEKQNAANARNEDGGDLIIGFHSLLAKASKDQVYIILERTLNVIQCEVYKRNSVPFRLKNVDLEEHGKLVDLLFKKDREKTLKLSEKHIITANSDLQ